MDVSVHEVQLVTAGLLKETVEVPWVGPKYLPVIVTTVPIVPVVGAMAVMAGGSRVKSIPLEVPTGVVTVTFPVVVPEGTTHLMDVSVHEVQLVTAGLLKETVEVPWVGPKYLPVIVTTVPIVPVVGAMAVMAGGSRVKSIPLEVPTGVVTVTFPVLVPEGTAHLMDVSVHEVQLVTAGPLKETVEVPWVGPKYLPVIVTTVPIVPVVGAMAVMVGGSRVNFTLEVPIGVIGVVTVTFPLVAPEGTTHLMDVSVHEV
jgi:hypothetical protein